MSLEKNLVMVILSKLVPPSSFFTDTPFNVADEVVISSGQNGKKSFGTVFKTEALAVSKGPEKNDCPRYWAFGPVTRMGPWLPGCSCTHRQSSLAG